MSMWVWLEHKVMCIGGIAAFIIFTLKFENRNYLSGFADSCGWWYLVILQEWEERFKCGDSAFFFFRCSFSLHFDFEKSGKEFVERKTNLNRLSCVFSWYHIVSNSISDSKLLMRQWRKEEINPQLVRPCYTV